MSIPGFFSQGVSYQLPHPGVDERLILIVHAAVTRAFELLRQHPPTGFVLASAKEDDITRQLEFILENRLRPHGEVPGFDSRSFGRVSKAPELTNVDGQHPAKKPDLVFDLKRESFQVLHTHDALFAECKPVDRRHRIPSCYCNDGMHRFINGDYAWTMQEAMMIAYVRDNHTIAEHLAPNLASPRLHAALGSPTPPVQVPASGSHERAEALHITTHQRVFLWPGGRGQACAIRIFHSWHSCS